MRNSSEVVHGFRFHALGGPARIRIAEVSETLAEAAVVDSVRWLRETEQRLSRFREDSLVSRWNRDRCISSHPDLIAMLTAADRAAALTAGRLDATAFPLWQLWHDPGRFDFPTVEEIAAARSLRGLMEINYHSSLLHLPRPGMAVDFGGVGKEWCVDRIAERLQARGIRSFLVELAGDLAAFGNQPGYNGWWVHLSGTDRALLVHDAAVATSGHGQRGRVLAGCRISHLIDAVTGQPASGAIRSATVLDRTCLDAGIRASDACLADNVRDAQVRCGDRPFLLRLPDNSTTADVRLIQASRSIDRPLLAA